MRVNLAAAVIEPRQFSKPGHPKRRPFIPQFAVQIYYRDRELVLNLERINWPTALPCILPTSQAGI